MYAGLWRLIPGPWFVKLLVMLLLLGGIVYALIWHIYPWVLLTYFPPLEGTVPQE